MKQYRVLTAVVLSVIGHGVLASVLLSHSREAEWVGDSSPFQVVLLADSSVPPQKPEETSLEREWNSSESDPQESRPSITAPIAKSNIEDIPESVEPIIVPEPEPEPEPVSNSVNADEAATTDVASSMDQPNVSDLPISEPNVSDKTDDKAVVPDASVAAATDSGDDDFDDDFEEEDDDFSWDDLDDDF